MIITDIDTLRALIPTIVGTRLDKYAQPLADAEAWLTRHILGRPLMDEIRRLQRDDPGSELFTLARLVVTYKGYLFAIPKLDVLESNNGFAVVNDDKLAPASRDRVAALSTSLSDSLSTALEDLIEYLEDSTEHRNLWQQSPAWEAMTDSYIPRLRIFRRYAPFKGSYAEYIAARPTLRSITAKHIEPVISAELSQEIIEQLREEILSEPNGKIIGSLRQALAAFYNNDPALGERCVCLVREIIEHDPDSYPAFKNSAIYHRLQEAAANKKEPHPSIHVML